MIGRDRAMFVAVLAGLTGISWLYLVDLALHGSTELYFDGGSQKECCATQPRLSFVLL